MRHVSAALVVLVIGACGKGAERSQPAPASNAAAPMPAPPPRDVPANVALPQLGGDAFLESVPVGPLAIVDRAAIIIDGTEVVPIRDGAVEASHRGATAGALVIPRIAAWAASWHALPDARAAVVALAVHPAQPATLALQVIASFAKAEQRDFALLARGAEGVGALPVRLPGTTPDVPATDLMLSLTASRAVLASSAVPGGAPTDDAATIAVDADGAWIKQVRQALTALVQRRAAAGAPAGPASIVVMIDPTCSAGALVAAVAAVRHDANGKPLAPDVRLGLSLTSAATAAAPPSSPRNDLAAGVALDEAEAARFAEMLTASGDSDIATMERRQPGSDLAAQLDAVRDEGAKVAVGGGTRSGVGEGRLGDGDPRVGGGTLRPGGGDGATAPDAGPVPGITITSKAQVTDTSLGTDEVLRKLTAAYMGGLKRCYREALALDPQLRGAVTLAFTVDETGRVTDAKVGAMTPALTACIEGLVAGWRFAVAKDGDGEPTRAEFTFGLGLAPR